jgi:hypothetical protein
MLRTAEGQSNAVFACFGSASQHAQLFEAELKRFLLVYNKLLKTTWTVEDLEGFHNRTTKMTMGALLRQIRQYVKFNQPGIEITLDAVLKNRNFIAHRYFLERNSKFKNEQGRIGMIRELVTFEQQLETATGWIGGLRVAMEETIKRKGKPRKLDDQEVVFSAVVTFPDESP